MNDEISFPHLIFLFVFLRIERIVSYVQGIYHTFLWASLWSLKFDSFGFFESVDSSLRRERVFTSRTSLQSKLAEIVVNVIELAREEIPDALSRWSSLSDIKTAVLWV